MMSLCCSHMTSRQPEYVFETKRLTEHGCQYQAPTRTFVCLCKDPQWHDAFITYTVMTSDPWGENKQPHKDRQTAADLSVFHFTGFNTEESNWFISLLIICASDGQLRVRPQFDVDISNWPNRHRAAQFSFSRFSIILFFIQLSVKHGYSKLWIFLQPFYLQLNSTALRKTQSHHTHTPVTQKIKVCFYFLSADWMETDRNVLTCQSCQPPAARLQLLLLPSTH